MAPAETDSPVRPLTRPCVKCRTQEATLDSRSQPVCKDCFTKFIATKCIKQIGILGKETRPAPDPTGRGPPTGTRRYLLGLSLGVSSTVLLHLLNENVEFQLAKGRNAPFELVVVHVDTTTTTTTAQAAGQAVGPSPGSEATPATADATDAALARLRARYPRFTFLRVPLLSPLTTGPDQTTKPPQPTATTTATAAAANFDHTTTTTSTTPLPPLGILPAQPTAASASDIRAHLTRRTLLAAAAAHRCQALLLGHSTTALAELTLAEAAKGRGVAVPWLVGDGPCPPGSMGGYLGGLAEDGDNKVGGAEGVRSDGGESGTTAKGDDTGKGVLLVYHPLRDALRKELLQYARLTTPPLTSLLLPDPSPQNNNHPAVVVSHKDLSIEEVMTRYFAEVEENYPSVVANVARTTGKLERCVASEDGEEGCALCGMPLDEDGDERWRGELGIESGEGGSSSAGMVFGWGGRLCYGCERSTGG